ncbi:MAG: rRNA maturation RNase YbeY [Gammaproteobacteria bacterium]
MPIEVDIQYATNLPDLPDENQLKLWVETALEDLKENAELTIRIVDEDEGTQLNERWRKSQGPTNVLSFTYEGESNIAPDLLGDIVICAPVIAREAKEQNKSTHSHWAHMVIHGVLHLTGFDHIDPEDAGRMENLEINILEKLNYKNPYLSTRIKQLKHG